MTISQDKIQEMLADNDPNIRLAGIMALYRDNPLNFFRDVLNVKLDKQQAKLVHHACKDGSRVMVKSARGVGKTFIITGLTLYFLLCFKDVNIRILSPSEQQLKTVFMREVRKHIANMEPSFREYYDLRTLSILNKYVELNVAHCITASVDRQENVSGVHAAKQVYLLDEASAIPDSIYSTTIGSLGTADGGGHFIGVSNPNRGSDIFYSDLFDKLPKGWKLMTFTAAECSMISDRFIEEQAELYGVDGDEYRVNVLGEFPRADGSVFIPESLVEDAEERVLSPREYQGDRIVLGADIARSLTGDKTVFVIRQGLKILEIISFSTDDTMETVARLRDAVTDYKVAIVFGDSTGVGGPVFDRVREVFKTLNISIPVIDVVVANRSKDPIQYFNVRAQLWGEMRQWLKNADIPRHYELKKELSTMTWGYSGKMQIQMTAKKKLRTGSVSSPDHADALGLTLAETATTIRRRKVQPRKIKKSNFHWI